MHEQEANKWPGLVDEVEELCDSMNLEDPRKTQKGRKEFSKAVKEACKWADEAKMKREMEKLKTQSKIKDTSLSQSVSKILTV